jgi:excisionase family DNA binding protein
MKPIKTIPAFRKQLKAWLQFLQELENNLCPIEDIDWDTRSIFALARDIALQLQRPDIAHIFLEGELTDENAAEIVAVALAMLDSTEATAVDKPLTVAEAAQRFNLSERTLYRLVEDGLPHLKARGAIRIKPSDLASYLEHEGQPEPVRASLFD